MSTSGVTGYQKTVSGLFRAHGFWSIGVQVMRNVNFAVKAIIVSVLFTVPIVWLSWSYFQAQSSSIEFSEKERIGVKYLVASNLVLQKALQLRSTPPEAAGPVVDALVKVYAELDKVQAAHGAMLNTQKEFSVLNETRSAIKNQESDAIKRFEFNTRHIQALITLMLAATDGSNLTLDPDIDSYYVMDAAAFRLPDLMERIGLIRAAGAAALREGKLKPEFRTAIDKAMAISEFHYLNMLAGIKKAVAQSPELESRIQIDEARETAQKFFETVSNGLLMASEKDAEGLALFIAQGDAAFAAQSTLINRLLPILDELIEKRISTARKNVNVTVAILVITLSFAIYAFYAFYLVTRGGLRLISHHLQEMASGDLRRPPSQPWGRDEPAEVILDLRKAYDSLYMLIRKVRHSARDLAGTSAEIARASVDLSRRTEASAAALEQQAATMEQIGSSVQAMADNSKDAAALARENADVAHRGGEVIRNVVSVMSDINKSSERIADIISVIDGIAFQTNILALNAAVEAARAGEQGRGFAVVANEVRVLAQRSASAAREIKDLINKSVTNVEQGTKVVNGAGLTMEEILSNAQKINDLLNDIAMGSREQADGVNQSVAAIQMLEHSTQQNAALVEETSSAATGLSGQADGLMREIANFRVA